MTRLTGSGHHSATSLDLSGERRLTARSGDWPPAETSQRHQGRQGETELLNC